MHCSQAAVYTLHQHQHPSHDPHLWRGSKCYQKGTPGLGRGLREKHNLIRENWGCNGVEMEFGRRDQEEGEQR